MARFLLTGAVAFSVVVGVTVAAATPTETTPAGGFVPVVPVRLLDTRDATGVASTTAIAAHGTVALHVAGRGGLPVVGVGAVAMNVTVTQPGAPGYITAWPDLTSMPVTSNVNFQPGQTVPNLVVAGVGSNGIVDLYNGSDATVHLIADVSGVVIPQNAGGVVTTLSADPAAPQMQGPGYTSVSCPSSAFCAAVGPMRFYGDGSNLADDIVQMWDGTSWTARTLPTPAGVRTDMTGVSCAGPTWCVAVGYASSNFTEDVSVIETWDGSTWSRNATGSQSGTRLESVSCPTVVFCVATGAHLDSETESSAVTMWDGSTWAVRTDIDLLSPSSDLRSVSCAAANACMAVGSSFPLCCTTEFVQWWDGTTWTVVPPSPDVTHWLTGVSCPLPAECFAVGYAAGPVVDDFRQKVSLIEVGDRNGLQVQFSPNLSLQTANDDNMLSGISCVSAQSCTAVGHETPGGASFPVPRPVFLSWNGTRWTAPDGQESLPYASLVGISCVGVLTCRSVGSEDMVNPLIFLGTAS